MKALTRIPFVKPNGETVYVYLEEKQESKSKPPNVKELYKKAHEVIEGAVQILARTRIHETWWRNMGMVVIEKKYIKKGKYKFPEPKALAKKILKA